MFFLNLLVNLMGFSPSPFLWPKNPPSHWRRLQNISARFSNAPSTRALQHWHCTRRVAGDKGGCCCVWPDSTSSGLDSVWSHVTSLFLVNQLRKIQLHKQKQRNCRGQTRLTLGDMPWVWEKLREIRFCIWCILGLPCRFLLYLFLWGGCCIAKVSDEGVVAYSC